MSGPVAVPFPERGMNPAYDILLIEDSAVIREKVSVMLSDSQLAFFDVHEACTLAEGLEKLRSRKFHAVLLDLGLPDSEGLETVVSVHREVPETAIVILTADDSDETVLEAMKEGTQEYLVKDEISGPLLQRTLRYAVERQRLEDDLRRQANVDMLTGLFSRRHLLDTLEDTLEGTRKLGAPLSVCLCDVDDLKRINDRFGHRKGDETLAGIGGLIRELVEAPGFAGRYGGDEILLVFPHIPAPNARAVVEDLKKAIDAFAFATEGGEPYNVTCTFGIAGASPETASAGDLINAADQALYEGKKRGRDRIETA